MTQTAKYSGMPEPKKGREDTFDKLFLYIVEHGKDKAFVSRGVCLAVSVDKNAVYSGWGSIEEPSNSVDCYGIMCDHCYFNKRNINTLLEDIERFSKEDS